MDFARAMIVLHLWKSDRVRWPVSLNHEILVFWREDETPLTIQIDWKYDLRWTDISLEQVYARIILELFGKKKREDNSWWNNSTIFGGKSFKSRDESSFSAMRIDPDLVWYSGRVYYLGVLQGRFIVAHPLYTFLHNPWQDDWGIWFRSRRWMCYGFRISGKKKNIRHNVDFFFAAIIAFDYGQGDRVRGGRRSGENSSNTPLSVILSFEKLLFP